MPSISSAQQSIMGQAWAVRTGEMKLSEVSPKYRKKIASIANGEMSDKELKKFASTKSKNLPHYVYDGKPSNKPVKESEDFEDELDEKGIPMAGATSPIIASKGMPTFTPGLNPSGGIKPITPFLNPDVQKPAGQKKMKHMADYRDFINKKKLNEISSGTFKSAINVSKERGTDRRAYKLGELYLNQFMDKDLIGGKRTNICVHSPQQGNYRNVAIEVTKSIYQDSGYDKGKNKLIKDYIYYDIDKDLYDADEIDRKDAALLSKIAQKINPDTKYKETGRHFKIKDWY
jgi:hypothetical protein